MTSEVNDERPMYGTRFADAATFACEQHHGQRRKGSGAPYVTHPMAVASLVAEFGGDEDQAIAALLHDVMEDCDVGRDDIAERFGEPVAQMVESCTDAVEQPKPPWRPRKEAHIAHVRTLPAGHKLVIACDKLHNARSIATDRGRKSVGETVWDRFRADRPDVIWYYCAMAEALRDGWYNEVLDELDRTIATFELDCLS
jgi:(p)ppGpp synthase/HD superfamily hydrolase